MKPLALLAGGMISALGVTLAHGQTVSGAAPSAMLQAPLKLPERPGSLAPTALNSTFTVGGDVVRQSVTEVSRRSGAASIDTLRLTYAESGLTPGGFASVMIEPEQVRSRGYEVDYSRTWPGAVTSAAGRYTIDISPEARVGYGAAGGSLGGGATVRVMSPRTDARVVERLARMGVQDGARFGDEGRWYLFAAARGRAVGFNMAPDAADGWSTDPAALVGDAQVGVGWRKGAMQTSLGYMVRRVRVEDRYAQRFVDYEKSDEVVGISFSYKPTPR